jgi:hypothetical protein
MDSFEERVFDSLPISTADFDVLCFFCRHYCGFHAGTENCLAFPNGIPNPIINRKYDHRVPFPHDRGIQFEPYTQLEDLQAWLREMYSPEFLQLLLESALLNYDLHRREGYMLPPLE